VLTVTLFSFMCMNNNAAPGVLNWTRRGF
jgi:hypothetical protein